MDVHGKLKWSSEQFRRLEEAHQRVQALSQLSNQSGREKNHYSLKRFLQC